jgi:hypothetical protein
VVKQEQRTSGACSSLIGESLSVYVANFWGFARLGPTIDADRSGATILVKGWVGSQTG